MNTTITDDKILLSKKGIKELKKKVAHLEHQRNEVIKSLRETDKTIDRESKLNRIEKLSNLEFIESEIDDKKTILKNAQLLPTKASRLQVMLGSIVELIDNSGKRFRYKIVNSIEADPASGRISNVSPLGQILLGKTVKDVVELNKGNFVKKLQLVQIM